MRKPPKRPVTQDRSRVKRALRLQAIIAALYAAAFFLAAFIVHTAALPRERVRPVALIALAISSILCGALAGRQNKKNGPLWGLLHCLPWVVLFLSLSAALNGLPDLTALLSAVILLLCAALGGTLKPNRQATQRRLMKGRRP
ncbi:MAG: TIGR04086 family membrane protein [Clostridia bacterium]|nr:TIGR04086 family membrane protein [Clostridia bacterium]